MASTAVSTSVGYNAANSTTHCGEVYCSETFNNFVINCTTCAQEFNLYSCSLFIKHIKECLYKEIENSERINNENSNDSLENTFTTEDNIEYVQIGHDHLDPLLPMKVEIEPLCYSDDKSIEDWYYLSDCKDEDSITIDKLAQRNVIEGIIDEYKNHPQLWNSQNTTEEDKNHHYTQIRDVVNSKFKTNLEMHELRYHIFKLKSDYRRARDQFKMNSQLWYFEKFAYIDGGSLNLQQKPILGEVDDHNGKDLFSDSENENSPKQGNTIRKRLNPFLFQDRTLILDIIAQYKKYSFLWNPNAVWCNRKRKEAFCRIAEFVRKKYKIAITYRDVIQKVEYLRSEHREAYQRMIYSNQPVTLWYYEMLSFLLEKNVESTNPDFKNLGFTDELKAEPLFKESIDDEISKYHPVNSVEEGEGEGLSDRNIVLSLIEEYRQNPCLWNNDIYNNSSRSDRCRANQAIADALNKKFNTNFSEPEVRRKIIQLRGSYRRVLRKKEAFEKNPSNKQINFVINLYYFNNIKFIGNTYKNTMITANGPKKRNILRHRRLEKKKNRTLIDSDEDSSIYMKDEESDNADECEPHQEWLNEEHQTNDVPLSELKNKPDFQEALKESEDYEVLQHKPDDDSDEYLISNRSIVLRLINLYKKHTNLWDIGAYSSSSPVDRLHAIEAITTAINSEFDKDFTESEIKNKIMQLKRCYRRVLRQKDDFEKNPSNTQKKFDIKLYYYDNISFIGETECDSDVSLDHLTPHEERRIYDDQMYVESDENVNDSIVRKPYKGKLTQNVKLLTAIIEEYKKHPYLWSSQQFNKNNQVRKKAYQEMAKVINNNFSTNFTVTNLSQDIRNLRCTYMQMIRRSEENSNFKSKMWYADLLSFIDGDDNINSQQTVQQVVPIDSNANGDDDENDNDSSSDSTQSDDLCTQGRGKPQSKKQVFAVIDLYKAAPILWDTNHPRYTLRNERKKAFENIVSELGAEYDYHVTADELRYNIRLLRGSFFRSRNILSKNNTKRFFHKRISFLEPYAKKQPATAPLLQIDNQPDPSEDFTYLSDNRNLMMSFIQLYEEQGCLWDKKHKDNLNPTAELEAYNRLINMFQENGVVLTKSQVISAISFLHATVVSTQKSFEADDIHEAIKEPIWFYHHLQFLGKIPRTVNKYCTHCNQDFHNLREYERHKIEIAGDFPYKCTICDRGFISRSKYHYHQLTHRQPHKCELCDFQAADKNNFQVHMLRHQGITHYRCEHCDKGFVTSSELGRHLQMHTGEKPIVCDICGAKYAGKSGFYQHMKRHRNQRDHKCEVCDHLFYSQRSLRDHMTTHSDERKHICETCGSAFKRKKTLIQHKSLHAEQKKHACKICGKLFAQKAGVYSHMKSHGLINGNMLLD